MKSLIPQVNRPAATNGDNGRHRELVASTNLAVSFASANIPAEKSVIEQKHLENQIA